MSIGLGLDTGGTYTDAVIMDLGTEKVVSKAKSLTTREDLSIGIRRSMEQFDRELLKTVDVVSVSSTLATNSVVEGKGCRVALICIGGDYDNSVNTDFSVKIEGGHDLHGMEVRPLDVESARTFLKSVNGKVDAIAITGYLAVRNPEHENIVKELAKSIADVPVVCGHELSSGLGFNERTATCIMNAMLIPVIDELIRSIKQVMNDLEIHAPLMIVRGDGAMMGESVAKTRPVETILCGPAASLIGAMHLTGKKDAIVMDMGGTTTDIGILRNGKPRLEPEGAVIGGKRTRVLAAEIATSGIGGDSRIVVNGSKMLLSSIRAMPICIASSQWDCVREHMRAISKAESRPTPEALGDYNIVMDCEMFRTLRIPDDPGILSESDMNLLKLALERPYSLKDAGDILNVHPFTFNIMKMESMGYIQRIGLTPTDILHAEGTYVEFDAESSKNAILHLSRKSGTPYDDFITEAKKKIRHKLCLELLKELLSEDARSNDLGEAGMNLAEKAISGIHGMDFGCYIKVDKPIIGIGAPAGVFIRWVGEVYGTDVLIHENSDVGNAIGAITSSISESVKFLIIPTSMGSESTEYEVYSRLGNFKYPNLDTAINESVRVGSDFAMDAVRESGATDACISVDRQDRTFTYGDIGGDALMDTTITVVAAGKPRQFTSF